ncbi:hypothetical protein HZU77_016920 [Neisseriaceae bacterium TC5R-5]|nr:hypothetical protein [Neisseriaceae bacterium TC5R-5]MDF0607289.1 hypothetical protein [Neisseriaceae bacterium TC5R-5]
MKSTLKEAEMDSTPMILSKPRQHTVSLAEHATPNAQEPQKLPCVRLQHSAPSTLFDVRRGSQVGPKIASG